MTTGFGPVSTIRLWCARQGTVKARETPGSILVGSPVVGVTEEVAQTTTTTAPTTTMPPIPGFIRCSIVSPPTTCECRAAVQRLDLATPPCGAASRIGVDRGLQATVGGTLPP